MKEKYKYLLKNLVIPLEHSDIIDLQAYYEFYLTIEAELNKWVVKKLQDHPILSGLISNHSIAEEQRHLSYNMQYNAIFKEQYNAIFKNDWEPYIEYQASQGMVYARMGIDFYIWYDLINGIRNYIMPVLLKKSDTDLQRILSIQRGINRFFDIGLSAIAEAYLDEKKAILEEEKSRQELINQQLLRALEVVKEKNTELEQFTRIASHDMQEPLRMVTSFLTQLEKKYQGQLDAKAQQYIAFAVDGATRMRKIILDLLEYSKKGSSEYPLEMIDTNELLKEVMLLNQTRIEENNAVIDWKNLPNIFGGKTPLLQVFSNLVGNALKYRKPKVNPIIKINATETDRYWQFSISDNGIGIEAQFFDKIFVIFQRLHNKEEYSGTGLGLAIVKKIIENHEGKIWLESKVDEGTTFYFTIIKPINI